MFAGTLAIAGIPGFAGFFSKDEILAQVFAGPYGSPWLWGVGVAAACLTSFYMFRLLFLTFFGDCRAGDATRHHIHESPPTMTLPLIVLAVLSVIGGYVGLPSHWMTGNLFASFLQPVFGAADEAMHLPAGTEYALMGISSSAAVLGLLVAYVFYIARPTLPATVAQRAALLYRLLYNKYYIDELYNLLVVRPIVAGSNWLWTYFDAGVVDGLVNGTAQAVGANSGLWRRWQSGNVQQYAASMLLGAMAILGYYALR